MKIACVKHIYFSMVMDIFKYLVFKRQFQFLCFLVLSVADEILIISNSSVAIRALIVVQKRKIHLDHSFIYFQNNNNEYT